MNINLRNDDISDSNCTYLNTYLSNLYKHEVVGRVSEMEFQVGEHYPP